LKETQGRVDLSLDFTTAHMGDTSGNRCDFHFGNDVQKGAINGCLPLETVSPV
jgi:hypothetical protein